MPSRDKETTIGGAERSFETTRWTQIEKAKTQDPQRRQASINNLTNRYWKPVYCYLRYKGYGNEDAKDRTQGFFCEIILGRELIQQADQTKGRFRTFLLTALDRYVTSIYRKGTAKKRLPRQGLVQLENLELSGLQLGESKMTPELAFHRAWATSLLDKVIVKVKDQCCSQGEETYWEVFRAMVLTPIFDNTEAPSLSELCDKYGIESEKKASNMTQRVKSRFRKTLLNHIRQLVGSDSEVEDEFLALTEILSKGCAA